EGFVPSPALGYAPGAPPVHAPEEWPPQICASNDACASVLFEQGPAPPILDTRCRGATPERHALEDHWPPSTVLHPRGTLASYTDEHWHGKVDIRLRDGSTRAFEVAGTIYYLSFWDERTLLVHVVEGPAHAPSHLSVFVIDAERGPASKVDLDFARGLLDLASHPELSFLPDHGNGRPVLTRLHDDLV